MCKPTQSPPLATRDASTLSGSYARIGNITQAKLLHNFPDPHSVAPRSEAVTEIGKIRPPGILFRLSGHAFWQFQIGSKKQRFPDSW
jgi:hypothetical protein